MHDLVARCDRVVAFRRVRYVRHAARRYRDQLIAFKQRARRHRYGRVLVRFAVVCPFIARRRDRDRYARGRHRQLTVCGRYRVVARRALRELVALHYVRYRALARERNAACDHCRDRVFAHQSFYVVLRPTLRCARVRERLVLRRDRQCCFFDDQLAGRCIDGFIITCDIFFAAHDLDCRAFEASILMRTGIRTSRRNIARNHQGVSISKTGDCVLTFYRARDVAVNRITTLLGAIIGHSFIFNRDRQRCAGNCQSAEFFLYNSIIVRVDIAPFDFVGIIRATRIGDRAGCLDRD